MSLLNHLAQAAQQLAGAKRKLSPDVETESAPVQDLASDLYPWPSAPWPYPQQSMQRSTQCLQSRKPPKTPNLSETAASPFNRNHNPASPTDIPSGSPRRLNASAESSASPSTEQSFRGWHDPLSTTTTNTSYANSPNLNSSLHTSQFGQPYGFPSHQYSIAPFTTFADSYLYAPNSHRGQTVPSPLAPNLGANKFQWLNATGLTVPLDCGEAILCNDPSCNDGIPCSGQHLPVCDKDDCDDAIPCPVPRLQMLETSYPGHLPDDRDCINLSPDDGFCCSDKCPQETRCPSPCFEENCDLPPCDVDHVGQMSWECPHEGMPHESMDGCIDPRHMFQNTDPVNLDNASWESRVKEQLYQGLRRENCMDDTSPPDIDSWKSAARKSHHHDAHDHCHGHDFQNMLSAHDHTCHHSHNTMSSDHHSHDGSCAHPKMRRQAASRRATREHRHTCQWVCTGDSNDPDAEVCGLEFADAKELQDHVVKHVEGLQREDDLFPCRWKGCKHHGCDGFMARPKLKRHLMVHTGATPYKCDEPGCQVEMKTKDALDKHKRTHTGAKPYLCTHEDCESRFATSTELKTHLIVHSGQKPHRCPRCGDCFADSSNLSKHKKVHEVPKFKCPDCDYKMKRWDQMRRHFKSQEHGLYIIQSKEAEAEYKRQMQEAFDKLTPEERTLPLSREGSLDSREFLRSIRHSALLKSEEDS